MAAMEFILRFFVSWACLAIGLGSLFKCEFKTATEFMALGILLQRKTANDA